VAEGVLCNPYGVVISWDGHFSTIIEHLRCSIIAYRSAVDLKIQTARACPLLTKEGDWGWLDRISLKELNGITKYIKYYHSTLYINNFDNILDIIIKFYLQFVLI
jgi:hypothetical protein